jgi:hypothetical protein
MRFFNQHCALVLLILSIFVGVVISEELQRHRRDDVTSISASASGSTTVRPSQTSSAQTTRKSATESSSAAAESKSTSASDSKSDAASKSQSITTSKTSSKMTSTISSSSAFLATGGAQKAGPTSSVVNGRLPLQGFVRYRIDISRDLNCCWRPTDRRKDHAWSFCRRSNSLTNRYTIYNNRNKEQAVRLCDSTTLLRD